MIPDFERVNSGTGREWKKSIPEIREREGNWKNPFPKSRNGKGMKKFIPKIREQESEAFFHRNGWEREFPLTPDQQHLIQPIFNDTIKSC